MTQQMGARYERAYRSCHNCVISRIFPTRGKSTDVGGANSQLFCLEGSTGGDSLRRKRTVRKADANKEAQYNKENK